MFKENEVKLIAFHLPQFHECEENNLWWGKGFTEWTNTKKAKKIYSKHNQPREPLSDNYYDLTKLDDIIWEMELARKYGIYGFCYYHYWFKGKLLLNRPLEIIRDYNGEKLPYCFCWANESWTRTWEGDKTVLMEQSYGSYDDWENHLEYLLSFFRDDKYIKQDGAPVVVLYRTREIPDCDKMIEYWDARCREEGYAGIYIIEELNSYQKETACEISKAYLEFEPLYTMIYARSEKEFEYFKCLSKIFNWKHKSHNLIYSYSTLWKNIIKRQRKVSTKKCYLGAFVDWDNTARKGKYGRIVLDASPKSFKKFLRKQKENARHSKSEYIFINAWNEWGEGAYLEPDKRNGYDYLEAVREVFQ